MTDDTTTWLKKNPVINPLRRSLKTSLRFHVNATEMDASIMSNPGKPKEQQIIVPRLLQRPSMRLKMLKANEMRTGKPGAKPPSTETSRSGKKTDPKLCIGRKSFLPVKNKPGSSEKKMIPNNVARANLLTRTGSAKKNNHMKDLMQKMMEATMNSNANQFKVPAEVVGDGSVIRSILKKRRASLRRSLKASLEQQSSKQVKKVLFEGLENSAINDKENESIVYPVERESDCDFAPLDEPTEIFLNFPKASHLESSTLTCDAKEEASVTKSPKEPVIPPVDTTGLTDLLKNWEEYRKNVSNLESMRSALNDSIQVHVERSQSLQNQFHSYLKNSQELHGELSRLGKELEENLKKVLNGRGKEVEEWPRGVTNSAERNAKKRGDKIRLSDKSKAIKKSSSKTSSTLKPGLWHTQPGQDNFALVERKGVFNK